VVTQQFVLKKISDANGFTATLKLGRLAGAISIWRNV